MNRLNTLPAPKLLALACFALCAAQAAHADSFAAGNLLVSRSVYVASPSVIVPGVTILPGSGGKTAVADASYPNVFNNETPDPSFGITSPIYLDQITTSGSLVSSLNVTAATAALGSGVSTSFPSKSELALNLSTDGRAVTFMSYVAPVNTLDVSNSNTPGHLDPTNPVGLTYQRAVVQVNANGSVQVTPVNAYSGNNGRAAVLVNNVNGVAGVNNYYMVGNAGNGSGTPLNTIVNNTGVQMTAAGGSADTTVIGKMQGTVGAANGNQYGFSVTQTGAAADKSGKDDNFRGMTVFNNTLYVTKGSGSNGVNTVYQVGASGSMPTAATAASTNISILPGFNTTLAKTATTGPNPFGIWFANANTLYVADEGDGTTKDAASSTFAGLQKWTFDGSKWNNVYTLQKGLNLGVNYTVNSADGSQSYTTATAGLRNLTGTVNADGTVSLYAVTSTVSGQVADQGADPNKLVAITDALGYTTGAQAAGETFTTVQSAAFGEVLRGVAFTPAVPEPETYALMLAGLGLLAAARKRARA